MYYTNNYHHPCGCPVASCTQCQPITFARVTTSPGGCPICQATLKVADAYYYAPAKPQVCDRMSRPSIRSDRGNDRMMLEHRQNAYSHVETPYQHQPRQSLPRNQNPSYPVQAPCYSPAVQQRLPPPPPPPPPTHEYAPSQPDTLLYSRDCFENERMDGRATTRKALSPVHGFMKTSLDGFPFERDLAAASQASSPQNASRRTSMSPSESISHRVPNSKARS